MRDFSHHCFKRGLVKWAGDLINRSNEAEIISFSSIPAELLTMIALTAGKCPDQTDGMNLDNVGEELSTASRPRDKLPLVLL